MTYGIITHYDVHNHGAVLQLNALVKVLHEKFGIVASALRFDKNYDFMGRELKAKYEISIKSAGIYLKYFRDNGLKQVLFNMKKKRLLDQFKAQEALVGAYYTKCENLDGVIIGSDEVFALHTGPTPVFFGYACPSGKVFAYAGSFGPTTLGDVERLHCRGFVAGGLSAMAGLSMRDQNSIRITRELTGREPILVCDPVILYGYEKEIAQYPSPQLPPYLLVYAYDQNMNVPEEVERIKDFARRRGLKIVSPGFYHKWADYNINVDPVELLRYFNNADSVLTDTFHGSVMSIISGRKFAVKLRNNAHKLLNLLQEYNLEDRVITHERDLNAILVEDVDRQYIHEEILRRRSVSMAYLADMING